MPTRKVIIVGGGIGMWVALNIARSHPDRIAGIMGLAADPDFTENLLWRFLPEETKVSWCWQRPVLLPPLIVAFTSPFLAPQNDIMEREYVSLYWGGQGYSISKALIEDGRKHLLLEGTDGGLNVSCPVRLLHGLDDKEVPYDISLKLAKRLKARDVTVTLIKGADHNMYGAFCAPYIRHAARDLISRCGSSSDLTGIGKVISNELSKTWS
jgi:pimeloyl-ACP methyl ester carboxylesterase